MKKAKVSLVFWLLLSCACTLLAEEIHVRAGSSSGRAIKPMKEAGELMKKGEYVAARQRYDEALRLDPLMWPVYYDRALVSVAEHKYAAAVEDCSASLRNKTRFVPAQVLRAQAYHALGRYRESLADLDHVIGFGPAGFTPGEQVYYDALHSRAWLRATCPDPAFRDGGKAVIDARTVCNATLWKRGELIDTMAAAAAEAGDFDSAVRYQERAIATGGISPVLMVGAQRRLALYKTRKPFRE